MLLTIQSTIHAQFTHWQHDSSETYLYETENLNLTQKPRLIEDVLHKSLLPKRFSHTQHDVQFPWGRHTFKQHAPINRKPIDRAVPPLTQRAIGWIPNQTLTDSTEWIRHYDSQLATSHDQVTAVVTDDSGNVYVTGMSIGERSGLDYVTIKYNSSGVQEWLARYNGPGNDDDEPAALAIDKRGNVYVTGRSYGGTAVAGEYATVKYGPSGVQLWVARYNGPGSSSDAARAIVLDTRGNCYVTGVSYGGATSVDFATIKYDSLGYQQWVARYSGPGSPGYSWDEPYAIGVDTLGQVYVTGLSFDASAPNSDIVTVKYSNFGVVQWVALYNGPGNSNDTPTALVVDLAGSVYVTGSSDGVGTSSDYVTIKYHSSGLQQWVARYNGPGNDHDGALAMAIDSVGNIFVTGGSPGAGTLYDYATIRYDSSGTQQWVARYDGRGNYDGDVATSIALDQSGNVSVTGFSQGILGDFFITTVKYDSAGVQQWVGSYNGPARLFDGNTVVASNRFGSVYVAGTNYTSNSYEDFITIKYSSSGVQEWLARYDGPRHSSDRANSIRVDLAGNVYILGTSEGTGTYSDFLTIKYGNSGTQQWVARFDGPGHDDDRASDFAVDTQGNVYVTGHSYAGPSADFTTVKYDSSGKQRWVARYNGGYGYDGASALVLDEFGNVYVTGSSTGLGGRSEYATVKYNNSGIQQWVARFSGTNNHAVDIDVDRWGNIYVTGSSFASGTGFDYATVKYNASGAQQWVARFNGPENGDDYPTALAIDSSGSVYVAGTSNRDYLIAKYDSSGTQEWVARYNGPGNSNDYVSGLVLDASNNIIVTGTSEDSGWNDFTTVKFNAFGSQEWSARYRGDAIYQASDLALDATGNVYVTGYSYNPFLVQVDFVTVKYDNVGVEQWVARYNGVDNSDDFATAIAVDISGNVFVAGYSGGNYLNRVATVVKYPQVPAQIPRLLSPANNSQGLPTSVILSWSPASFAQSYDVQLGRDSTFSSGIVRDTAGVRNTYLAVDSLRHTTTYYWRVRARGLTGISAFSSTWHFSTFTMPLTTPTVLLQPTDGATDVNPRRTFLWQTAEFAADYHIQMSYDSLFASTVIDTFVIDTSFAGRNLLNNQRYYWRVAARNGLGQAPWSSPWSFTTAYPPPSTSPSLLLPPNGAGGVSHQNIRFVWRGVTNATSYFMHAVIDTNIMLTILRDTAVVETSVVKTLLNANIVIYWRIAGQNGSGRGPWAQWSSFRTQTTGVGSEDAIPTRFSLEQNYPNPFNPSSVIKYGLPRNVHVRLSLFNTLGQLVQVLVDESRQVGYHEVTLDASSLASGVYLYRIETGEFVQTKKLIVLR